MNARIIPAVTTRGITKKFGKTPAVTDVDPTLNQGRVHALIGPSGAGKTTLLSLMAGLSQPTAGSVHLLGVHQGVRPDLREGRHVGALIGQPLVLEYLTAVQNLVYHCTLRGIVHRGLEDQLLGHVGLTEHMSSGEASHRKMRRCAPAVHRKLGVAIAMIGTPELVFLDEPLDDLDDQEARQITRLVMDLAVEHGSTVVVTGRELEAWQATASNFIVLNEGRVHDVLTQTDVDHAAGQFLRIVYPQTPDVVRVLEEELGLTEYTILPGDAVRVRIRNLASSEVIKSLASHEIWASSFTEESRSVLSDSTATPHPPRSQS